MGKLLEFFQEDNGSLSSTRLIMFMYYFCVIAVWTFLSMKKSEMVALDAGVLAGMGLMSATKVVQKFTEKPITPTMEKHVIEQENITATEERIDELKKQ